MYDKKLINFDKRVIILFFLSFVLFYILVFLRIHGSSIAIWDKALPGESQSNLIWGESKSIRGDEWSVITPAIISQAVQIPPFPVHNESLGAGETPLLTNLPVKHFSIFFKPQYWGFFIFEVEKGFSFYWNFKSFGLFLGFFILLLLITGSNFWLSFFGSLWLFLSSFTQWWFSTPAMMPEMIMSFSISIVSFLYVILSPKRLSIILGALFFTMFFINFILCFYPPFQIPLFYLLLVIIFSFCFQKLDFRNFLALFKVRIIAILLSLMVIGLVLYFIYCDTRGTFQIIKNTFYPGSRVTSGGGYSYSYIFSGLYNIFLSEEHYPKRLINVCEASNFILLAPLLILIFLKNLKKWIKKDNALMVGLLIYQLCLIIWIVYGFPAFLTRNSLFSIVPPRRSIIGLGVSNILLSVVFINIIENYKKDGFLRKALFFFVILSLAILQGITLNKQVRYFFTIPQIALASILFSLLIFALINRKRGLFAALICLAVVPNFLINPVSAGLGPILKKEISIFVSKIKLKDPKSKWVVFGRSNVADFLKASGVNIFNGTKMIPDVNALKILDPELKNYKIYNRYSHITFLPHEDKDKISFILNDHQSYSIIINPANKNLSEIGVYYFVFTYKPKEYEIENFTLLTLQPVNGLWIYKAEKSLSARPEG